MTEKDFTVEILDQEICSVEWSNIIHYANHDTVMKKGRRNNFTFITAKKELTKTIDSSRDSYFTLKEAAKEAAQGYKT